MADHSEFFLHLVFIYFWGCFILDLHPWTIITETAPKNALVQIVRNAHIRQVVYNSVISAVALHVKEEYGRNVFNVEGETYDVSTAVACVRFYCIVRFVVAIFVVTYNEMSPEHAKTNRVGTSGNPPTYEEAVQDSVSREVLLMFRARRL